MMKKNSNVPGTSPKTDGADSSIDSANIPEVEVYLVLHDGTVVQKTFVDALHRHLEPRIANLPPDQRYTAEMLCGCEYWEKRDTKAHIKIGRCIAYMVLNNLLPLAFTASTVTNAKRYVLK